MPTLSLSLSIINAKFASSSNPQSVKGDEEDSKLTEGCSKRSTIDCVTGRYIIGCVRGNKALYCVSRLSLLLHLSALTSF